MNSVGFLGFISSRCFKWICWALKRKSVRRVRDLLEFVEGLDQVLVVEFVGGVHRADKGGVQRLGEVDTRRIYGVGFVKTVQIEFTLLELFELV